MMLRGFLSAFRKPSLQSCCTVAAAKKSSISTTASQWKKKMPDRPAPIDEGEFTEVFLKGSGPGGQKINKTSSAVQLKHIPTGLVLKIQETRSRSQNRKIARQMLAERVELMEKGKESRVAVVGETKRKKKSSATKKSKRKYRALAEEKAAKSQEDDDEDDEEEEEEEGDEEEAAENVQEEAIRTNKESGQQDKGAGL